MASVRPRTDDRTDARTPTIDDAGQRPFRLVLIGGGPSCVCVLLRLAATVPALPAPAVFTLVDPAGETGGGAPHAATVSPALLLNDSVAEMDSTGIGLIEWLTAHRERWHGELAASTDPRVADWVRRHATAVRTHSYGQLYLPRIAFGQFMRERLATARTQLAARGITLETVTAEVTRVRRTGDPGWLVESTVDSLACDAVVLGVGNVTRTPPPELAAHPGYLTFEQARDLRRAEPLVAAALRGDRRITVLGSSAAATEFLFAAEGSPLLSNAFEAITVVSPSGQIAGGLPSLRRTPYRCEYLSQLTSGATSRQLVAALSQDMASARALGYRGMDGLGEIEAHFTAVFAGLDPAEKRRFVHTDCHIYRELVRHTSPDYAAAVQRLREQGRLTVLAARVHTIEAGTGNQLVAHVADRAGNPGTVASDVLVDCRGFAGAHDSGHPVVSQLVRSATLAANTSGRGLRVDHEFQAAPDFYVLGPLLAGTSQGVDHIWYLENVPRIYTLADRIAAALWRTVAVARRGA